MNMLQCNIAACCVNVLLTINLKFMPFVLVTAGKFMKVFQKCGRKKLKFSQKLTSSFVIIAVRKIVRPS